MEEYHILKKISSKYIFETIFSYIKDRFFLFDLFKYSKFCQNKFDYDFKSEFLFRKLNKEKLFNYLNTKEELYMYSYLSMESTDDSRFKKIISSYFKAIANHMNFYEDTFNINFNKSWFFHKVSTIEEFEKVATFTISLSECRNSNYYKTLENLKFSSFEFSYSLPNDIEFLKKLKLNLNQVKKLIIKREHEVIDLENKNQAPPFNKDNICFIKNILNDLVYLKLSCCGDLIDKNYLAQNINNFSSLKYLYLYCFEFDFL